VKWQMTVANAQPVNHRRSALELSQSDWSCRPQVAHRCQWRPKLEAKQRKSANV
jgi:hypothetical protein